MGRRGGITLANLVVNVLALVLVDYFVKGILEVVSLPITCLTLGLFEIVISGFILKIVDVLMPSVYFASMSRYFLAVIIIAIVNALFGRG